MASDDLFTMRFERVTRKVVEDFLRTFESTRSAIESSTVEFKRDNSNSGVAKAISGMANARGGLVFVGIDENAPTVLAGCAARSQDAIVSQCHASLDPTYVPDDIAVVPADAPGEVVLVIRVEPQPHLAPMFHKNGVYVRAPGSTMPATRDQLLAMVNNPAGNPRPKVGSLAQTLLYSFRPEETLDPEHTTVPDLTMRVAGTFMIRATKRLHLMDDDIRRSVMDALEHSKLFTWACSPRLSPTTGWRTTTGDASRWSAELEIPRRGGPGVRIALTIIATLERLTWIVNVELNEPADHHNPGHTTPTMQARDMLRGLIEMITFADTGIGTLLSNGLPDRPVSPTELAVWVVPRSRDLLRTIALDQLVTTGVGTSVTIALRDVSSDDLQDVPTVLGDWFAEVLLNAGVVDGAATARDLVGKAIAVDLRTQPWF